MDKVNLIINKDKETIVRYKNESYCCYAIRTHVVSAKDKLADIFEKYVSPTVIKDDIVFVSEKMVACTQGRAVALKDISAGRLATFLSGYVRPTSAGIGLGTPKIMQCAIDEAGKLRILTAAAAGFVGRLFRQKGWFHVVAGRRVSSIDGPSEWTLPPYNEYVILAPTNGEETAKEISTLLGGNTVLIVDVNDIGASVLASSHKNVDVKKRALC